MGLLGWYVAPVSRHRFTLLAAWVIASPALAKDGTAKRMVVSLGAGVGAVGALSCEHCASADGTGLLMGVGLEVAGRLVAFEMGTRLLRVVDESRGTTGHAPSLLLALRLTPWRAIFEVGAGAGYVTASYDDDSDEGVSSGGALVHAAIGVRLTDHLRLLAPLDLIIGDGIAGFVGVVVEAAFFGPPPR